MHLKKIGVVHSSYQNKSDAPRQGKLNKDISKIEIHEKYIEAMKGLEELSHIIVLYWADKASRDTLITAPPWSKKEYGVFALRSPNRPNPINFCVCEIVNIKDHIIKVKNLDAIDGSAVLDIKVYSPSLDAYPDAKTRNNNNIIE